MIGTNIVHLPTVKTHVYTTMTGAMKNAFGGLLKDNRHWAHTDIHKTLVDLLAIQKEIHPGMFAVMDGTICGDGAGPRAMIPVVKNYMLASDDMVAIDAVSAWLMGFDPLADVECIRVAHERGLGWATCARSRWWGRTSRRSTSTSRSSTTSRPGSGRLLWFTPLARIQAPLLQDARSSTPSSGAPPPITTTTGGRSTARGAWPRSRKSPWGRLFAGLRVAAGTA